MAQRIRRGDMYYADLNPVIGSEQGGNIRPVIIVQNNTGNLHSPTVIVAAITSKEKGKSKQPTHVPLTKTELLHKSSVVLLEQIRTIDRQRLGSYIGTLNEEYMCLIDIALAVSVGLFERMCFCGRD